MHLDLLNFCCFFVIIYRVTYCGYMSRLTDPEEPQTEEYELDYTEGLGDDLLGAMSHPTS